jgi:hypothetical protein
MKSRVMIGVHIRIHDRSYDWEVVPPAPGHLPLLALLTDLKQLTLRGKPQPLARRQSPNTLELKCSRSRRVGVAWLTQPPVTARQDFSSRAMTSRPREPSESERPLPTLYLFLIFVICDLSLLQIFCRCCDSLSSRRCRQELTVLVTLLALG